MIQDIRLVTVQIRTTFKEGKSRCTVLVPLKWVLPQSALEPLEEEIQCGLEALIMQFPEHVKSLDGFGKIEDG